MEKSFKSGQILKSYPIDHILPELKAAIGEHSAVVLQAPPGSGKTTRVPLALLDVIVPEKGRILMLEPRRIAGPRGGHRAMFRQRRTCCVGDLQSGLRSREGCGRAIARERPAGRNADDFSGTAGARLQARRHASYIQISRRRDRIVSGC